MSDDPKAQSLDTTPEAATAILAAVAKLTAAVGRVDDKVDTLAANVQILTDDGRDTKQRLSRIETWKDTAEDRLRNNSIRAKEPSQHDLETASALAEEIGARKALAIDVGTVKADVAETKTLLATNNAVTAEIKTAVSGWFKQHPAIGFALTGLVMAAITAATTWLSSRGGHP